MAVVDREDLRPAGRVLVVVLLILGTALVLGLAVRIFLLAAGLR